MADMTIKEGFAPFGDYQTWYRIIGDLHGPGTPLVILHGGPGCTHDYVDSFKDIASTGRAVIHYDQLGNGQSTRLPHKGRDFWTVKLFLSELANLLEHLGIKNNYALLGQSWGGMLASEHAVRQPKGLKALIIANSPADMLTWVSEANRLREDLPLDVQAVLLKHEEAKTLKDPEYLKASRVFYDRHVCRITPWPYEVKRTFDAIDADPTVYHAMNGSAGFHVISTLKNWTIIDRLKLINVPTLLISGKYDEATPLVVKPYVDNVPNIIWSVFEESSHMPHVEERMACMGCIAGFMDTVGGRLERPQLNDKTWFRILGIT
ncbi:proline iminopeptidase-family hydrolase [Pseudomonas congelans]|uniref:proline iminopeptidase-family hydrolase n=1 Tax=Pseudomonas congelans TaxID=200452 RepID=UPI001EFCD2CB|nr:proline iminopeptidase-family hydrolase [Pseudomonas congelans]